MNSPKVTQKMFDALFLRYIRQMSKRHRIPKEIEDQLINQILKKDKF